MLSENISMLIAHIGVRFMRTARVGVRSPGLRGIFVLPDRARGGSRLIPTTLING